MDLVDGGGLWADRGTQVRRRGCLEGEMGGEGCGGGGGGGGGGRGVERGGGGLRCMGG